MERLLVIADDLTGALDTGVVFAKRGMDTRLFLSQEELEEVLCSEEAEEESLPKVLVLDAESRHLPAEEAYGRVYRAAEAAAEAACLWIYKKTDSALRGNVGSELQAVLDASGGRQLHFAPAFPRMERIVREGVLYIDGRLLSDSVFGQDPFEPMRESRVAGILQQQTKLPVLSGTLQESFRQEEKAILLYDTASQEELSGLARCLLAGKGDELSSGSAAPDAQGRAAEPAGKLQLFAGCAAFADCLAEVLAETGTGAVRKKPEADPAAQESAGNEPEAVPLPGLFVLCGSLNPVTLRQLDRAEEQGFMRIHPLLSAFLEGQEREEAPVRREELSCWKAQAERSGRMILDSLAAPEGCSRQEVARQLAAIMKVLWEEGLSLPVLCTGGDTLRAVLAALGDPSLRPLRELKKGVVLNLLEWENRRILLISKSGGFGEEDLLTDLLSGSGA